ncbi:hypothetical protein VNO78_23887 [Psophocarpus tetragonolobus]|uniref:Uncharacterized protein n=1 Tax=Psophocarpus tetragonolobus TaxID=3891 RepID=A0AAN9XE78_PSOTE
MDGLKVGLAVKSRKVEQGMVASKMEMLVRGAKEEPVVLVQISKSKSCFGFDTWRDVDNSQKAHLNAQQHKPVFNAERQDGGVTEELVVFKPIMEDGGEVHPLMGQDKSSSHNKDVLWVCENMGLFEDTILDKAREELVRVEEMAGKDYVNQQFGFEFGGKLTATMWMGVNFFEATTNSRKVGYPLACHYTLFRRFWCQIRGQRWVQTKVRKLMGRMRFIRYGGL